MSEDLLTPVCETDVLHITQVALETASHVIVDVGKRDEYQPTGSSEGVFQKPMVTVTA